MLLRIILALAHSSEAAFAMTSLLENVALRIALTHALGCLKEVFSDIQ